MNGRVYDPMLGRFGTPDPMTEDPYNSQGWNRYTYVGNSPLNATDPSGYCWKGCFWQKPFKALGSLLRKFPIIGQIIQVAAIAIICAGSAGSLCAGAVATISSAVTTGLASGSLGQALRAGLITAATATAFYGVGELTTHNPAFGSERHIANIVGHAAVGCGSAVASGGKCGPGALSGAVGSFAAPLTRGLSFEAGLIAQSTMGGLASVAGGGKFGNGAVTAAFGYLFNQMAQRPVRGAPIYPYGDSYVPDNELPMSAREILQYREFWYDERTGTWRVGFTVPYDSEISPTVARRGEGAGTEQVGYVVTPPGAPPFAPGTNPLSAVRLGFSTPSFDGPYFIVYNAGGQPISPVTGRTVSPGTQHYPLDPVSTLSQSR